MIPGGGRVAFCWAVAEANAQAATPPSSCKSVAETKTRASMNGGLPFDLHTRLPGESAELRALALAAISGLSVVVRLPSADCQVSAGIAAEASRPALDLDEEQALGRENEQVHLVDAAIVGQNSKFDQAR